MYKYNILKKVVYLIIISYVLIFSAPRLVHAEAKPDKEALATQICNKEMYDYRLSRGVKYYRDKKYQEAIIELEKAKEFGKSDKKLEKYLKASKRRQAALQKKMRGKLEFYTPKIVSLKDKGKVLSFDECVNIAVENHLPAKIAKEQIKLAKLKTYEAARSFFPTMTASYTRSSGISRTSTNNEGQWQGIGYGLEMKQPVFHGGEITYSFQQAAVNLKIAEENYNKVRSDLIIEVGKAYYALAKSELSIESLKNLEGEFKSFYDFSKKASAMEIISKLEALNIESLYNQAVYQKLEGESELDLARLTLEQKMNLPEAMNFDIDSDLKEKKVEVDMNEALRIALLNRSELKISFMTVESSRYGQLVAQSKMWPRVDLAGKISKSAESYTGINNNPGQQPGVQPQKPDPTADWYFGVEFSWLLGGSTASYNKTKRVDKSQTISTFYGGSLYEANEFKLGILDNLKAYSDQKEADIVYKKSINELNETKQKVTQEVKEAYYNYRKSTIQLAASKSKVDYENKETKILDFKRSMGETEVSEVMNARLRKSQSEISFYEALASSNFSIIALNKAVGIDNYFSK